MKTEFVISNNLSELTLEEQYQISGGNEASAAFWQCIGVIAHCVAALAQGAKEGSNFGINAK